MSGAQEGYEQLFLPRGSVVFTLQCQVAERLLSSLSLLLESSGGNQRSGREATIFSRSALVSVAGSEGAQEVRPMSGLVSPT